MKPKVTELILVLLTDPICLGMIVAFAALFLYIGWSARQEEHWLAEKLGGADWHVQYRGRMLALLPFSIFSESAMSILLIRARPLAIKEVGHVTAWLCKCNPVNAAILAVRRRHAEYPRVVLRYAPAIALHRRLIARLLHPLDPSIAERFPRLCREWIVIAWGEPERAATLLSAMEEVLLDVRRFSRISGVETNGEYLVIMGADSLPCNEVAFRMHGGFRFVAQANRILKAAGVPDLFAAVSLKPDERDEDGRRNGDAISY